MADEKLKIRIVPEYLPHYLGEVEIDCMPLDKIKTQSEMFDVLCKLKPMLERVKGAGFMLSIFPDNKLLKIIHGADFLFLDKNGKLDYEKQNKTLTAWFCESLEQTIENCEKKMQYLKKSDEISQIKQGETPNHIQDLIELGYIDKNYRNIQSHGLQAIIDYVHGRYPNVTIDYQFIKQFKKSDGKDYGNTRIYNVLEKIKAETKY